MKTLFASLVVLTCSARDAAAQTPAEDIGSSRGARIAYAMPADPDARAAVRLVFFAGPMPDDKYESLSKAAPNVTIVRGLSRDAAADSAAEAHGVESRLLSPALLERATNLVWVQSMSAGVDRLVTMPGIAGNGRLVLTNMRAVHGPAIADHAFAMLLTLTRSMRPLGDAQKEGRWERDVPGPRPVALSGRTMLVVGLGGIGSEIARRAHGIGMRVTATRRSDTPPPAYIARQGGPEDLLSMLPEADVVAVCVPLTSETEGLFNAAAFGAMKQGSYLINIARGRIVNSDALIAALKSGRLAGACLDVTDPEPRPAGHPLWSMENVVITPHVAADAEVTDERRWVLLRENLRRFGAGEPLLNTVDVEAGY